MLEPFTALADLVAYRLLSLPPASRAADAVHFFVEDVSKIFTLLVLVVFGMAFFRSLLTPEKIRRAIEGQPPGLAYGLAAVLGAVTPFCSCSSVPLFIGFLEGGIPLGVTMAFLITSPLVNEVAVVILISIMGWSLTGIYVGTGMAVGILGGLLIDRLGMTRHVEPYVWTIRMGPAAEIPRGRTFHDRTADAWGEVREIVGRIWLYVLGGIGLGALLHGYMPQDLLVRYAAADNPLAVPVAVLIGLPLYSNATGVIPVAEALIAKAVPIGTVIAFMMSVVAISPPEFIMLRKVLKLPLLAFLAGYLTLAFILVGYLLNALFL